MAKQMAFHVEAKLCAGCKTCQVACKDRASLDPGQLWRKVTSYEDGGWVRDGQTWRPNVTAYWISMSCNHCDKPACVGACPTGAMHKRESDGIVLVDQSRCVGCQYCTWACPYDAPQYNPKIGKMGKCDFCADRLAEGKRPVCVDACPFQLIDFGTLAEMEAKHGGTAGLKGLADPGLTGPAIRYTPPKAAAVAGMDGRVGK